MKLKKLIENLENTLEKNGYTLEDLKKELCDCGNEEGGEYANTEETTLEMYNDRLEKIIDIEDKDEKIKELKKLLEEMKSKYKGNNPSKEVKTLVSKIRKLLDAEGRGHKRTPNSMIR